MVKEVSYSELITKKIKKDKNPSYKEYASVYGISTVKRIGEKTYPKTVSELLVEIYNFEKTNGVRNGLYSAFI